jgi:hypothetical protein
MPDFWKVGAIKDQLFSENQADSQIPAVLIAVFSIRQTTESSGHDEAFHEIPG